MILQRQYLRALSSVLHEKWYRYAPLSRELRDEVLYCYATATCALRVQVTLPTSPVGPDPTPQLSLPEPVHFPLSWLLDNASPPLQYRAIVDVAKLDVGKHLATLPLAFRPALELALSQSADGVWNNAMLSVPEQQDNRFSGVGTIPAFRRLLEYGWDNDAPPLIRSRRTLFRLLAEDDDPAYLFELGRPKLEPELVQRGRTILREAAAAALAQAGYEGDPRLRGAAQRMLQRVDSYVRSALAKKPWIRVANRQVLSAEAAPPSIHLIAMVAHMPLFRRQHHAEVERLFRYLSHPLPRQESQQLVGGQVVNQPHLVLGDMLPNKGAVEADVPFALMWLELMARLHFLRRSENWINLFERFLDDRDRDFVWHPHRGLVVPRSANPAAWPMFPLEPRTEGEGRWSDVTFRLGLIARLLGRPVELV